MLFWVQNIFVQKHIDCLLITHLHPKLIFIYGELKSQEY